MRLPFFYGWIIVAVTFVTMAIGVNARTAFSLFFPPIIDEFGWERGVTAGAFSFGFLVSGAVSPLIGRLMDRAGPRAVMELGVALMAGGMLLAPLTTQPWHLYLTIGVMVGSGSVCLGYSGQSLFLPNWFNRRRGPGDRAGVRRRRRRLDDAAAVGAAHDRADRMAHRLHGDGNPDPGGARADQSAAAQAPRGYRAAAGRRRRAFGLEQAGLLCRRSRLGRHRLDAAAARFAPRGSGGYRSAISAACTSGTRCRFTRPNFCSTSASARTSRSGRSGAVSLLGIPGQIWLGHLSDRVGREWIWTAGCSGFAICFAALIALKAFPSLMLVYLMVLAQGALGYGLTSIMGAVVLEIFQGKHFGSIFGTVMLAALAGGAAGPWVTGALHDLTGSYAFAFAIGIAMSALSALAIWMASPRKVRAVAGQLHKTQANAAA